MKRALRRAVARVVPEAAAGGVRVLLYHAVEEPDSADWLSLRVRPASFHQQMMRLRDAGYAVVPLAALLDPPDEGRLHVAITFDDGYRSQLWAADVLREFGFPATFFVTPRFLDGVASPAAYWERWGHLQWSDAAALLAGGFEIGAHSMTHPDLRRCSDAELESEVAGVKDALEQRLGASIVSFSYPYGRYDDRVKAAATRTGYRLACTSRYGVNRTAGPAYAVYRTEVAGTDDATDFRWKLAGKYDWLGYWQNLRPSSW